MQSFLHHVKTPNRIVGPRCLIKSNHMQQKYHCYAAATRNTTPLRRNLEVLATDATATTTAGKRHLAQSFSTFSQQCNHNDNENNNDEAQKQEFLKQQQFFLQEYRVDVMHLGTKHDYQKTIDCMQFIQDFHTDILIPGTSLMLMDAKTCLGEDLTHVKVNRDIMDSKTEEDRFTDLLILLRKVLYREKLSKDEIIRWHQLRGPPAKLPQFYRDYIINTKYGMKGRSIFGFFITDSDIRAYGLLGSAILMLAVIALYGKYKKRKDFERAEENYMRMLEKKELEQREQEKIAQMAYQRQLDMAIRQEEEE